MKTWSALCALALLAAGCSASSSTSSSGSGTSGSSGASGSTGSSGTIDPGCTVSEQGSCQGNVAVFCYANDLDDGGTGTVSEDCSSLVQNDPSASFTCGQVTADYGVDCLGATGDDCGFQDQQGHPVFTLCAGSGAGCLLGANGAKCATGQTPCANLPDGGDAPAACVGTMLQVLCQVDQPVGYDCASMGGTCSNLQCINLTAGAPCDLPDAGQIVFVCGSGLHCDVLPDGGGSACGT